MSFPKGKGRGDRYGAAHQAERKALMQGLREDHPCCRCGHAMGPKRRVNAKGKTVGLWHYDHAENGGYLGFAHGERCPTCGRRCNVSAGASKGARIVNAKRKTTRAFTALRDWT